MLPPGGFMKFIALVSCEASERPCRAPLWKLHKYQHRRCIGVDVSCDFVWTQLEWQMFWSLFIVLAIVCHVWQMFCHRIIVLADVMPNVAVGMATVTDVCHWDCW